MSSRSPDWNALNAYVDGELEPADAAEIAKHIAHDPALAHQAAALTGMKAALAAPDGVPTFDFDLPTRRRNWQWLAVAASVVVVVAAATLWIAQFDQSQPAWLVAATTAHDGLAAQNADNSTLTAQSAATAGFQPYIPDLAAAKLSLAAAAPFAVAGSPEGLSLQFTGTRGCRVTYLAFPADGHTLREELTPVETAELSGYSWRVGAIGYALVAEGMDPNRLSVIAQSVYAGSRLHRPFDDATRTQLARSRSESRACTV